MWQRDRRRCLTWNRSMEAKWPLMVESLSTIIWYEPIGIWSSEVVCKMKRCISWWLTSYSDVHTGFGIRWWQCRGQPYYELVSVKALGFSWISLIRHRSGHSRTVLRFLSAHTWNLCSRILKKRLVLFEDLEWISDQFSSRILCGVQEEFDFLDIELFFFIEILLRYFSSPKITHADSLKQNKNFLLKDRVCIIFFQRFHPCSVWLDRHVCVRTQI